MMTGCGSPSSPSGDLSVDSNDPPIANIVTGPRKKRRKNISAIASPQVELGANHLDLSDQDGSPVSGGSPASESEAIYAEMKNIVGLELVTEIKRWSDNDPAKNQQFIIEQNGSPGFDLTDVPLDYVCLPVDKFLHLFEAFKCTKCHARHKQNLHWRDTVTPNLYTTFVRIVRSRHASEQILPASWKQNGNRSPPPKLSTIPTNTTECTHRCLNRTSKCT
jgi:hypothetical protein